MLWWYSVTDIWANRVRLQCRVPHGVITMATIKSWSWAYRSRSGAELGTILWPSNVAGLGGTLRL